MKQSRRELFNDINITPLTDIFLVLLIIMIVVAPLLEYRGLDMTVSVAAAGQPEKKQPDDPKRVRVAIASDGQYKVDGNAVPFDDLANVIRNEAAQKPDGVVIETDPESNHAALTHAIDAAQVAGVTQLSVIESKPGD
jgi:biopolymer transport protein ExbD/biopolymer transport protein TolR